MSAPAGEEGLLNPAARSATNSRLPKIKYIRSLKMHEIRAGMPLVDLLSLAYQADQPVLLHGRHGVGKSALVKQAAQQLNVQFIVRDLSLMEPPDLVGIPRVSDTGRTVYAAPSFLPGDGKGILML